MSQATRIDQPTLQRVVVPIDGWPESERALLPGQHLAQRFGVGLLLLSAVEDEHEVEQRRYELASRGALLDVPVEIEVRVDPHVIDTLLAHEHSGEIVVMATSGSSLLHDGYAGSMAERVLRRSGRPTVLVGREVELGPSFEVSRVMAALDGSDRAQVAVDVARWWAEQLEVPLWLVQVLPSGDNADAELQSRYLRHVAAQIPGRVEWDVLHGRHVADELADAAGRDGLLVMATHGRTGLKRLALGSVAAAVTKRALQPVVVVAAPDLQED